MAAADLARALEDERALLDRLARIAPLLVSELDRDRLMQRLTDEATSLVGARFGAFFYNVTRTDGESYMLYTLSGAPREAFEKFGMPRNTAVFGPTFAGEGIVRSDDIRKDPRYGKSAPHYGMPKGHLPVVSYLAAPVKSRSGDVLGGLFFGHEDVAVFGEREERALASVAALAGAALDNARLFEELSAREAQLERATRRYRLVTEATREGIWFWDVGTNAVSWNDRLLEMMGIERSAWGGSFEDWFSRVHPDDQPRMSAALKAHLERREPYQIDLFRLRHASGEYRWMTTAGQAEWDGDGRPLRMAGSVRDVSDRKAAEDALRASEHRHAQILDSVEDMIFCKNPNLTVVYANAATCRYYGATPEQLRGLTDVPYNQIDFTKQYNADDREVFTTGRTIERHEEPNVAPNGELRWFHTVKSAVRDADGNVVELVGVSRDVTDRRREAEQQRFLARAASTLASSLDYETTLSNIAEAMVPGLADWAAVDMRDANGTLRRLAVAHVDPQKVQLAHELQRRLPQDPNAATGVPKVLRTLEPDFIEDIPDELLAASTSDPELLALMRSLGLRSSIVVPLRIGDEAIGAISLVTAESKRRYTKADLAFAEELARRASIAIENARLYAEVRDLNASLERRVEERTAALLEANKELESFSYSVSHDLRAPIRHIGGFVDLLRAHAGSQLDDKSRHYVDTIKRASTQMGTLIDGLLAFSRLGRAQITKQRVDLRETVEGVLRDLEPDTKSRTITFDVGELPVVAGDPTMLRLVMANLLSNAVKYTRHREHAHVAVGSRRDGNDHVVWVKDDGVGFNMDYASKLFGVFQRLHSDDQFEGTGIGLATTRRVIHRHGGRVWAEGAEGVGATFYFTLPAEEPRT